MGRIKGTVVKRLARELLKKFPADFSLDFEANKVVVKRMKIFLNDDRERNQLAGELSVLARRAASRQGPAA